MNPAAALARRWLSLPPRSHAARHDTQWVPLADGVRLATSLVLPRDGDGPWPTVLIRTASPAHEPGEPTAVIGRLVAEMGHAVVIQECRGRYASEGTFAPFVHEAGDGGEAIAWIARQPWFDGRLALVGWGYAGFAAWAALSASPRPVAALVAIFAARDPYTLLRPGGALALDLALRWGVGLGEHESCEPSRLDLERGLEHRPLREADRVTCRRVEWFREWIDHPVRDAYWAARVPALPDPAPPALLVAGWRQSALAAQLADFAALREQARRSGGPAPELVLGPWPGGQLSRRETRRTRSHADSESLRATLDFLARHLRGEPAQPAPVRVFLRGANVWRETSDWPFPETEPTAFFLCSAGHANGRAGDGTLAREAPADDAPPDGYRFDPRDPVISDDDGAAWRDDVLCYTSEPLAEPLTLAGPVRAVLFAASSAAVTDFTASLTVVTAEGSALALCDGVLRSRGAPDAVRRLELDLGAAGIRLVAGERLRLSVSSSSFPRWDRPSHTDVEPGLADESELAPAQQSVFHDRARHSHVSLPLLRAARARS